MSVIKTRTGRKPRKITIKASAIKAALDRAARDFGPNNWQAGLIEIALIPAVYRRFQDINTRFPMPTISRHAGKSPKGMTRADNIATGDAEGWAEIAGYTLGYGTAGYCWNSVKADYYAHAPSTVWDGIRREMHHVFIESLRNSYLNDHDDKIRFRIAYLRDTLAEYGIEYVDDLAE